MAFISIPIVLLLLLGISYSIASILKNKKHLKQQANPKKKYKRRKNVYDTNNDNQHGGFDT